MAATVVEVNRAPVLTLWAAVVAERQGYDWDTALTLGKVMAGLNAQAKGRGLGIYTPKEVSAEEKARRPKDQLWIMVCGRAIPALKTPKGIRALVKEVTVAPESVKRYLETAFGESLNDVRKAMEELAGSVAPTAIEERAFGLYERFRPQIASGTRGWGQKGKLDLDRIRSLAGTG